MKQYKSSVIAACILAVTLICWFAADRMSIESRYNKESARTEIISLERNDIKEISFENSDEQFTLVNNGTSFVIKERNTEADEAAVELMLENILKIDGKLIAENCKATAQYGLDTPRSVVIIRTQKKDVTLTLGNLTPAETEYYLMNDDGDVYSIYTSAGSGLSCERWMFMDLTIFTSDYDDIKIVSVSGENGFSAEKGTNGVWKIESKKDGVYEVSDKNFRAKAGLYFDNMYAKRLVPNNDKNRAAYGLDSPESIVTIISKNNDKTEFKVSRNKEKQEAAIIKNDGEDIFIAIDSYFDMLDVKKDDLI